MDFYDEINFSLRDDGKINRTSGNEDIPLADDLMIKSAKKLQKLREMNAKTQDKNSLKNKIAHGINAKAKVGGIWSDSEGSDQSN